MNASISESCGVKRIKLEGMISAGEAPNFADFLDKAFADGSNGAIWDLSALDPELDGDGVAVIVEAFSRVLLENGCVVVLEAPERLVAMLNSLGMGRVISLSADDREAMVEFFKSFEKKYDDGFFQLLLRDGYITAEQLEEAHAEYDRRNGETPIDEIMLEMELITVEDILRLLAKRKTFLGEILVDAGLITKGTLIQVLDTQKQRGGKIGDLLKEIGAVTDRDIYEALAIQYFRKTELADDEDTELSIPDHINFLASDDYLIVRNSIEKLIRVGPEAVPEICSQLKREDLAYRHWLAYILGEIRDGRAIPQLGELLTAEDVALCDEAYWALVKISGQDLAVSATWRWGRWVSKHAPSFGEGFPKKEMDEQAWQLLFADLCEGARALDDFSIEYEAGRINWEGGKVNLLIDGAGRALLKRNCRGDITLASTSISAGRLKEFLASLYENKVWSIATTRNFGDLNEPRNVLTFRVGNEKRLSVFYWATEMYGDLALMNIENAAKVILKYLAL